MCAGCSVGAPGWLCAGSAAGSKHWLWGRSPVQSHAHCPIHLPWYLRTHRFPASAIFMIDDFTVAPLPGLSTTHSGGPASAGSAVWAGVLSLLGTKSHPPQIHT